MKLNNTSVYKLNLLKNMFESDFLLRFDKYDYDSNDSLLVNNKAVTICKVERLLSEVKQFGQLLLQIKAEGNSKIYVVAESPFVYGMVSEILKKREFIGLSRLRVLQNIVQNEKLIQKQGGVAALLFFGEFSHASVRAARRLAPRHPFFYVDIGRGCLDRGVSSYKVSSKLQTIRQIVFLCTFMAHVLGTKNINEN